MSGTFYPQPPAGTIAVPVAEYEAMKRDAEWSVSFCVDYGRTEDEDDLRAAIDAAKSTGEDV